MPYEIDETHDPNLESWVESANDPESDFPIQNLPMCRFERNGELRAGVRIGDRVLDLARADSGFAPTTARAGFPWSDPSTGADSGAGRRRLRDWLVRHLKSDASREDRERVEAALIPVDDVSLALPVQPLDYTDFYASVFHATNVGSMFRPDNPLLPNYKHVPIAYHGRASSIVASGTGVRRPVGQQAPAEEGARPQFGPSTLFDYEMEVGAVIGRGNELGEPISIADAEDHLLGLCLVNDWSARDLQKWEYQPLGPFLAKSFATSVSPYIVTMEALAPFRAPAYERPAGDPRPLAYLDSDQDRARGGIDLTLEVYLQSAQMRERGMDPIRLSRGTFKDMYWTVAQMVAHHTVNGCNLQPGDLLASGTVSGPTRDSRGCLLELTWDGDPWADPPMVVPGTQRTPLELPTGEARKFLEDGDEVILKGYCEREGFRRIGFGECRGRVAPARAP